MRTLGYIFDELDRYERGMAPHYPLLYAVVRGLECEHVLEFGAGTSSRVILDALDQQGRGHLWSHGTDPRGTVADRHDFTASHARWTYIEGDSRETFDPGDRWYDLILHDGSHTAEVVRQDLLTALPRLRRFGLAMIHDTQHSHAGADMKRAVCEILPLFEVTATTLPYGAGLTILRMEDFQAPAIRVMRQKRGSPHRTVPGTLR